MTPLGPFNWPPHIGATREDIEIGKRFVIDGLNAHIFIYKDGASVKLTHGFYFEIQELKLLGVVMIACPS